MTCIKNLLPAEVNSLQLRQTQVLVFFLKQKQHLKMWVYLGLKEKKKSSFCNNSEDPCIYLHP